MSDIYIINIHSHFEDNKSKVKVEITVDTLDIPPEYVTLDEDGEPDQEMTGGIIYSAMQAMLRGGKVNREED